MKSSSKSQFIYPVGTKVLCFEPDPNKAKIIYQAKILEHKAIRTENKVKKPIYQVHFQGWKDRWNREVHEDMLLSDNAFNRRLKKEIEKVARRVRNKDIRRERIDEILDAAALVDDDKIFDWQKCPGVWTEAEEIRRKSKVATDPNSQGISSTGSNDQVTLDHSDSQDDQSNGTVGRPEDDEIHLNFTPRLDLSDTLKLILEEDYSNVHLKKSNTIQLQFPASPNVVDLLQTYVNGFPYAEADIPKCNSESKDNDDGDLLEEYLEADRSPVLCAETCSGLRILFDFLLRDHLLYKKEYDAHDRYFTSLKPGKSSSLNKSTDAKLLPKLEFPSTSGRRSARQNHEETRPRKSNESKESNPSTPPPIQTRNKIELLPLEERLKDPELPCLSYGPIHFLRLFVKLPDIISKMSLTLCRRAIVLRHLVLLLAYLEQNKSRWFPDYLTETGARLNESLSNQPTVKLKKLNFAAAKATKLKLSKEEFKRKKKKKKTSQPVKQTLRKLRHR